MNSKYQWGIFWALFIGFGLSSCLDSGVGGASLRSDIDVIPIEEDSALDDEANDYYEIIAVTPHGENWDVIVEYSGGCDEHTFYIGWNLTGDTIEVSISHDAHDDPCEAYIRDTLSVDLAEVYKQLGSEFYVRVINYSDNQNILIDPHLAALTSGSCEISASIGSGYCQLGATSANWLVLSDTVPYHGQVYLRPVRTADGVSFEELETTEKVKLAFDVLFGYDYEEGSETDFACTNTPEGTIVPVIVNCIDQ